MTIMGFIPGMRKPRKIVEGRQPTLFGGLSVHPLFRKPKNKIPKPKKKARPPSEYIQPSLFAEINRAEAFKALMKKRAAERALHPPQPVPPRPKKVIPPKPPKPLSARQQRLRDPAYIAEQQRIRDAILTHYRRQRGFNHGWASQLARELGVAPTKIHAVLFRMKMKQELTLE
jgi:hypothetical protein